MQRLTVGALLKPDRRAKIPHQDAFSFCRTPDCDVVYFRPNEALFRKDDLSVRVHQKEPNDPTVHVCYCFDWTPGKIRTQIEQTGQSTAVGEITARVKADNCYCEVTNPQGSCCLGNVAKVVGQLKASVRKEGVEDAKGAWRLDTGDGIECGLRTRERC